MAKFKAFEAIDMRDTARDVGYVSYGDAAMIGVSTWNSETWYVGDFDYRNDRIVGTIEKVFYFTDDELHYQVTGLDLSARYIYIGATMDEIISKAFAGADTLTGSRGDDVLLGRNGADRLFGRDGNDTLRGDNGNDRLLGQDGRDHLEGGNGRDFLHGGAGADKLRGDAHDDTLTGGSGSDMFIFGKSDGRDRIADFEDGRDLIQIRAPGADFDDLRIRQTGEDVRIVFEDTRITLLDTDRSDIDAGDFLF